MEHSGRWLQEVAQLEEKRWLQLLPSTVVPVAQVLTMCFFGFLLATNYVGVLNFKARRLLGKLVFSLFLPCLIFCDLGGTLTLEEMGRWWFIPVNVIISVVIGCLAGTLVAVLSGAPAKFTRLIIVMTGVGNIGNIPLAIVNSVCRDKTNPFDPTAICRVKGVAYISFAQWVGAIIIYTFVYHMLEPPPEFFELVNPEPSEGNLLETEFPSLEEVNQLPGLRTPLIANFFAQSLSLPRTISDVLPQQFSVSGSGDLPVSYHNNQAGNPGIYGFLYSDSESSSLVQSRDLTYDDDSCVPCVVEPKVVKKIRVVAERTPLHHLMQPPVLASILAIVVGSIPQLKGLLFGETAPFAFVTDSLTILSNAMIPCIMISLGGNLITGPGQSDLSIRATALICVMRLLILPLVGMLIVQLAGALGWFPPDDRMFRFVLLLQHSMPASILAGAVASLRGYAEKEVASLMFWQHILSFFSLMLFVYIFVYFLF